MNFMGMLSWYIVAQVNAILNYINASKYMMY